MQRQAVPLLRAEAPYRRHRHGARHGARFRRRASSASAPAWSTRSTSERIIVRVEGNVHEGQMSREVGADIYQLTKFKRSNQNTCINQKPIVHAGPAGQEGRRAGRRSLHRHGRTGAGPQRSGGLHAVARLQLRRRDRGQREAGQGRLLHLDPHRRVRSRRPRHQAGSGGNHARYSEHRRDASCATSTRAASFASAPRSSRATSWSAK